MASSEPTTSLPVPTTTASSATAYAISAFLIELLTPDGNPSDQTVVDATVDEVKVMPAFVASCRR